MHKQLLKKIELQQKAEEDEKNIAEAKQIAEEESKNEKQYEQNVQTDWACDKTISLHSTA